MNEFLTLNYNNIDITVRLVPALDGSDNYDFEFSTENNEYDFIFEDQEIFNEILYHIYLYCREFMETLFDIDGQSNVSTFIFNETDNEAEIVINFVSDLQNMYEETNYFWNKKVLDKMFRSYIIELRNNRDYILWLHN